MNWLFAPGSTAADSLGLTSQFAAIAKSQVTATLMYFIHVVN
jgi:hypothetical protein